MKNLNPKAVLFSLCVGICFALNLSPQNTAGNATVNQVQGVYVFVKSKPSNKYQELGQVTGKKIGSHEFDELLESMIERMRKEFPKANGIIFDSSIKQSHNTKAIAIFIE